MDAAFAILVLSKFRCNLRSYIANCFTLRLNDASVSVSEFEWKTLSGIFSGCFEFQYQIHTMIALETARWQQSNCSNDSHCCLYNVIDGARYGTYTLEDFYSKPIVFLGVQKTCSPTLFKPSCRWYRYDDIRYIWAINNIILSETFLLTFLHQTN